MVRGVQNQTGAMITMINREDMLELTRRMNISRNCFSRIAGCYLDNAGFEDGSFNVHFGNLSAAEQKKNLTLAKTVPFAQRDFLCADRPASLIRQSFLDIKLPQNLPSAQK